MIKSGLKRYCIHIIYRTTKLTTNLKFNIETLVISIVYGLFSSGGRIPVVRGPDLGEFHRVKPLFKTK